MTEANNHQIRWAEEQLQEIKRTLDGIRDELDDGYVSSPSNTITKCQQAIEISAKSIFKLMGYNFPTDHNIQFEHERTQSLLKSDFPEYFSREDEIPRVIFFTQFWYEFYETSKYGDEEANIPPATYFKKVMPRRRTRTLENAIGLRTT